MTSLELSHTSAYHSMPADVTRRCNPSICLSHLWHLEVRIIWKQAPICTNVAGLRGQKPQTQTLEQDDNYELKTGADKERDAHHTTEWPLFWQILPAQRGWGGPGIKTQHASRIWDRGLKYDTHATIFFMHVSKARKYIWWQSHVTKEDKNACAAQQLISLQHFMPLEFTYVWQQTSAAKPFPESLSQKAQTPPCARVPVSVRPRIRLSVSPTAHPSDHLREAWYPAVMHDSYWFLWEICVAASLTFFLISRYFNSVPPGQTTQFRTCHLTIWEEHTSKDVCIIISHWLQWHD